MFSFVNANANFHLLFGRGDKYGGNGLDYFKGMESKWRCNLDLDDDFCSI